MMSHEATGPLKGVVVLDLSMFIAGPYGSMMLADLGAEVIKIEPLTGDPVRSNQIGPRLRGENAQFYSVNRNKRSLALDLKKQAGRNLFLDLARRADIVWENFRPGVAERLGIDYQVLREINPRIIYCAISGFGAWGPYRDQPAFDLIVQALGGNMSINGEPGRSPAKMGMAIGDLAGGMFGVQGVLAALYHRERTGQGQRIDIGLLDCQISMLWEEVTQYYLTGVVPGPMGSGHPYLVPYQAFDTSDGAIVVVGTAEESFWQALCRALELPDLLEDPRFRSNGERTLHRQELIPRLAEVFGKRPSGEWLELLRQAGVPAAPVNSVAQAVADPQVASRQMVVTIEDPAAGPVRVAGNPIKLSDTPGESFRPAPRLGEHTREVLAELLGLSEVEIQRLQDDKCISA